jgi:O-antigen/teichoic acid export membrane protein
LTAAKNTLSNLITRLLLYPIGFLASIWISRYLGPEEKGIYAYIVILISFFIPIFSLGIGGGFRYYISNKEFEIKDILFTTLIISIGIGLLNALLIYLFFTVGWLGETGNNISPLQLSGIALILVFNSIYFFLTRISLGNSQFHMINFFELLKSLLNPVFMILFVFIFALRIDGVMLALIILNLILATGMFIRLNKYNKLSAYLNYKYIKKSITYGVKGWLGDMAVRANVRLDQLILGGVISPAALGIYSISVTLAEMVWILPDSIGTVLFNKIAEEKDTPIKVQLTERIHRLLFSISFVISIIWAFTSIYIIIPYGYGEAFQESAIPLLILIPGALFFITSKITTKLLSGSGQILQTSKATALGSIISIILYIILIPKYGILGAAAASSIGYIVLSLVCYYYTTKHYNVTLRRMFITQRQDIDWLIEQIKSIQLKRKSA